MEGMVLRMPFGPIIEAVDPGGPLVGDTGEGDESAEASAQPSVTRRESFAVIRAGPTRRVVLSHP